MPTTTELPVTLKLTDRARAKLAEQAAETGQDVSAVASHMIELVAARATVDELMGPFRKQVAESGMTDEQLDDFHRDLLAKVRSERRAKSQ
jgi:hypothetical protein